MTNDKLDEMTDAQLNELFVLEVSGWIGNSLTFDRAAVIALLRAKRQSK